LQRSSFIERIAPCTVLCWNGTVPEGRPSSVTLDLSGDGTWDMSAVNSACTCGIGTASPPVSSIVMTYHPPLGPSDPEY
jgi:hypothetical protein